MALMKAPMRNKTPFALPRLEDSFFYGYLSNIFSALSFSIALFIAVSSMSDGFAQTMPKQTGTFKKTDLVEINKLAPSIKLDIRYATKNNFLGRPFYTQAKAFLQRPAANALVEAHQSLSNHGYGLLITDAYRPWSVTKAFWEAATPYQREAGFVANPKNGSRHNRGCAIDVTLYDLKTGKELAMPSAVDEMSIRAAYRYQGGEKAARDRRDLLRKEMEAAGFIALENEWWHFDYKDWKQYRIIDTRFENL
jgi:zinc D-Ala-D-Ala dipeptidase